MHFFTFSLFKVYYFAPITSAFNNVKTDVSQSEGCFIMLSGLQQYRYITWYTVAYIWCHSIRCCVILVSALEYILYVRRRGFVLPIHIKNQALFSLKDKRKKLKCPQLRTIKNKRKNKVFTVIKRVHFSLNCYVHVIFIQYCLCVYPLEFWMLLISSEMQLMSQNHQIGGTQMLGYFSRTIAMEK